MSSTEPTETRESFAELSEEQCIGLLGSTTVGRVAFLGRRGIEILPVNFVYHDHAVLFRTSPHGPLAILAAGTTDAAFEIDYHDDQNQSGWSVLVTGHVAAVTDPAELDELMSRVSPHPWADGDRSLILRLEPKRITGRSALRRD